MPEKIPDKWLYVPVVLLGIYFFVRLIDQSKLIHTFPLDSANDLPAYMASLFFLVKCGFNKFCPYWYNGFISFHTFSPGWQFFTYPIYILSKNILFSTYVSIILIYALSFFFIFLLGKNERFSIIKRIVFFLFFFTNAVNVGNFFKLGRVVELFGWCMFLGVATVILYYKHRKIDRKILFLIPVFSFSILSHPQETVLTSLLILSLFLIKRNIYEKLTLLLTVISSMIITSFWWIPFILNLSKGSMIQHIHQGAWLWATNGSFLLTSIAAFFVSLAFFIIFYYYWLSKGKSKRELLFFSPIILLNILFFFRITPLIPVLRNISPDPYIVFFIFFIVYCFLNINPVILKGVKKLVPYLLMGFVLFSVSISHFKTPYFIDNSQVNKDTLETLKYVNNKFMIIHSYNHPAVTYYSYAPIYLNLTTAGGYYPHIISDDYYYKFASIKKYLDVGDCDKFITISQEFNVTNFITYDDNCIKLKKCGLEKVKEKNIICLYKLSKT